MDIALENVPDYKYKESEDPCKYKSAKTGRGPLMPNWRVSFSSPFIQTEIYPLFFFEKAIYETNYVCI